MGKITVGIMYDFDKTLCTPDMQNYDFMKNLAIAPEEFWKEASMQTKRYAMDKILSYMLLMIQKSKEKGYPITESYLTSLGKSVLFYRGVQTWFDRINAYGASLGVRSNITSFRRG